ncbi:MAG: DUF3006 domain-containing protein [Oscillospiraceae bacterium]|nr:DUF3006 domain-containing protein [Oscillospiraceae bacterium]
MILVERVEDGIAVLEITDRTNGMTHRSMPVQALGLAVHAGDVLYQTESGWQVDTAATEARRRLAAGRFHRLIQHDS